MTKSPCNAMLQARTAHCAIFTFPCWRRYFFFHLHTYSSQSSKSKSKSLSVLNISQITHKIMEIFFASVALFITKLLFCIVSPLAYSICDTGNPYHVYIAHNIKLSSPATFFWGVLRQSRPQYYGVILCRLFF